MQAEVGQGLLGGLALVIGSVWLLIYVATLRRQRQARRWPTVTGSVLDARLEAIRDPEAGTVYRPRIRYRYRVGAHEYWGERVWMIGSGQGPFRRQAAAERWLHQHTPGRSVTVYYNPQFPEEAFLEPPPGRGNLVYLGAGLAFVLGGALLAARALAVWAAGP